MGIANNSTTELDPLIALRLGVMYEPAKRSAEILRGFGESFVCSLIDAGVQSPWNGVAQLVDRTSGKALLPELHIVETQRPAPVGTADWCGQLLGGSVGMAASYMWTREAAGKLIGSSTSGLMAKRLSAGAAFAHEVPYGAFYSSVFVPVGSGEGEFWSSRFRHGISGGLTMGVLSGVGCGIGNKVAVSERSFIRNVLGSRPSLGMMAGIPAGIVNSEASSLLEGRGFASPAALGQASLEFALVGGTLGIAHQSLFSVRSSKAAKAGPIGEQGLLSGEVLASGKSIGKEKTLSEIQAERRLQDQSAEIAALRIELDEARKLATTDPLTGALNRRAAMERLQSEISACQRSKRPLSMIFLDIDHFKRINDNPLYGHAGGDAALIATANILRSKVRAYDSVCRMGGEEFCVILPGTDIQTATSLAHRLRTALDTTVAFGDQRIPITASLGVAELGFEPNPESLISRADRAMYGAKETGRNRVVVDGEQARVAPL